MKKIFTVLFLIASIISAQVLINEVDADQVGTDSDEFIELYDGGTGNTDLGGLVIVLFNGADDASYDAIDLDGFSTDGSGYFIIGSASVANVDLIEFTTNGIQNGADAVALYSASASDFPDDTPVTTMNLIDALVYDTDDGDDSGLLVLLNSGEQQINERGGGDGTGHSNQRFPDGSGGARNTSTYIQTTPTPGNTNLPVELTTFSASVVDNNVELNWETATEVNNYGFEVQRKTKDEKRKTQNESEWQVVSFVNGHGNSNSVKIYSFTDNSIVDAGRYLYRLKQIDIDGSFEYSSTVEVDMTTQIEFKLSQNFPNPFNPTTSIQFSLPEASLVKLVVFNVIGEQVAELINKNMEAGYHNVEFNASELNSGIYVYKLEADGFTQIRKMMLVK